MFDSLVDFCGIWTIRRRIIQPDGTSARFEGQANWLPDDDGLRYEERGQLFLEGKPPMQGERCYLWRSGPGRVIEVYFDDGRPFHRIDPDKPTDSHWCDPDQYEVSYDFSNWPIWSAVWAVQGPRKNYQMTSTYKRQL